MDIQLRIVLGPRSASGRAAGPVGPGLAAPHLLDAIDRVGRILAEAYARESACDALVTIEDRELTIERRFEAGPEAGA